ncbi:MAG: phosphonate ABC transporter, permease protein PhnE [Herpetosiphon sp.]
MAGMQAGQVAVPRLRQPSRLNARTGWAVAALMAISVSVLQAHLLDRALVNWPGHMLVLQFVSASVHPDLSWPMLQLAAHSAMITLIYAVAGTTLSLAFGLMGCVFSSEVYWQLHHSRSTWWSRTPLRLVRTALAVPRGLHEAVWALFFVQFLGLNPLTAVLGIALPFGAITAKVYAELLDETPRAPLYALHNSGVTPLKALWYGVLPQAGGDLLSYAFYRFECAIRAAVVLGIIGAGGLGYQVLLSLQSLRYGEMWTLLYALILLCGLTDMWSSLIRRRLQLPSRVELDGPRTAARVWRAPRRDPVVLVSIVGGFALVIASFWLLHGDFNRLVQPRTMRLLSKVLHDSLPPRLSRTLAIELVGLSFQTLSMSILAMTFAGTLGLVLSFPAAHTFMFPGGVPARERGRWHLSWGLPVFVLSRGILLVARAVSAPVWALVFLFVLFPGVLPGAIALGLYNLGVVGRLMAEVTENLDRRPLGALQAQGATGPQIFLYGVLPRTLPRCLAFVLYRWEVCIRASVIVGLVGAGGLGRLLTEQLSSFDYRGVSATLLFFFGLTLAVDFVSAAVRRRLR